MLPMPAQIEIYEQMCALSTRMVEAARANDWERLIDLEHAVADLRETLLKEADKEDDNSSIRPREAERKHELIQRILRDDAEVRLHTEPWMEQVRRFLTGNVRKQPVDRAYGAGS
ncbi:MAG: flagellar protein FliT [Rhodocyclaceae bacterium]|nr:flagellar protein FliT [Rhodocyclaceae bacterium]